MELPLASFKIFRLKEFNPQRYSVHCLSQITLETLLPSVCFPVDFTFLVEAEGRFFVSAVKYDSFLGF